MGKLTNDGGMDVTPRRGRTVALPGLATGPHDSVVPICQLRATRPALVRRREQPLVPAFPYLRAALPV